MSYINVVMKRINKNIILSLKTKDKNINFELNNDLYNHYRKLKTKDRETFRTNLDLIDQEPSPEAAEPLDINEGFSRFLGRSL